MIEKTIFDLHNQCRMIERITIQTISKPYSFSLRIFMYNQISIDLFHDVPQDTPICRLCEIGNFTPTN